MNAVWKDKDINISTSIPIEYGIEYYSEDSVFSGVAVPKPGTNYASIRISDFAKNMVNSTGDINRLLTEQNDEYNILENYCREIVISAPIPNGKTILYADYFYNSYDYNNPTNFETDNIYILSNRIGKVTNNGNNLFTLFNTYETEMVVMLAEENEQGARSVVFPNIRIPAMSAVVCSVRDLEVGVNYVFYDNNNNEIYRYKVSESCNRYNLHYQNAMGGYDTISIDGRKDKRTDNLTFDYYKARGNNQDINQPQMNKYKVDITPQWELQTGWINDNESKKMYNIFSSQNMWLEDTETGVIYPVYITNNNVVYKTFTNQGRKKYNYTFSITSSNTLVKL